MACRGNETPNWTVSANQDWNVRGMAFDMSSILNHKEKWVGLAASVARARSEALGYVSAHDAKAILGNTALTETVEQPDTTNVVSIRRAA